MQVMLVQQSDLRNMCLLLIRLYAPETHHLSQLKCVVKLNHKLLMMTQHLMTLDTRFNFFDMQEHVQQYVIETSTIILRLFCVTYIFFYQYM